MTGGEENGASCRSNGAAYEATVPEPSARRVCQPKSLLCFLLVSISAGVAYNASYVFLPTMTTTLERRFGFDSEDTGRIIVANDVGFAATVTLVSFYGNRGHRPRVLGFGAIVMGLSTAAYSLPYFIYGPKYSDKSIAKFLAVTERRNASSESDSSLLCAADGGSSSPAPAVKADQFLTSPASSPSPPADAQWDSGDMVFGIFMAVGIIQGAASAPSWSVLFTMVEDSAVKSRSPIYIGLVITARSLSPMLGYYLVAQFLTLHESIGGGEGLYESDSIWIGNWWLGLLSLGLLTSALGCPMLMFPRSLEDRLMRCCSSGQGETTPGCPDDGDSPAMANRSCRLQPAGTGCIGQLLHSLRDLAMSIRRIMTNVILMLVMLSCVVSLLGSGLEVLFIVKYYENYFNVLPSTAGQYVGLTYALPTALATFAGGFLVSKLKLTVVGMMQLIFGIFFVTTALNAPAFFLACPSERFDPGVHAVTNDGGCSSGCGCDTTFANRLPVCGTDGNLYLSPCHAGCTDAATIVNGTDQTHLFHNCACIGNASSFLDADRTARSGYCHGVCNMVYPFSVLKFISHFVDGLSFVSWFLLVMRLTNSKDDEAMGVGIISLFFSLAASIMGGFCGKIYESACIVATSGAGQRNCLLYDKDRLRVLFNGIPMLARLPYFALLLAANLLIRRRYMDGGSGSQHEDNDAAEAVPMRVAAAADDDSKAAADNADESNAVAAVM